MTANNANKSEKKPSISATEKKYAVDDLLPLYHEKYIQRVSCWYLQKLMDSKKFYDEFLCSWLIGNSDYFNISFEECETFDFKYCTRSKRRYLIKKMPLKLKNKILKKIKNLVDANAEKPDPNWDIISRNVILLGDEIELNKAEQAILTLVNHCGQINILDELSNEVVDEKGAISLAISVMTGLDHYQIKQALLPSSYLIESDLMKLNLRGNSRALSDCIEIPYKLANIMMRPHGDRRELQKSFLGEELKTTLKQSDYPHLSDQVSFILKILNGATKQKAKGVNILFYGPPGTGKTELAKTLAKEIKVSLYSVGEQDTKSKEPDRSSRLFSLHMAQKFLQSSSKNLVLFDEIEDLFLSSAMTHGNKSSSSGSKVYMNRLLENNPVPTIWIANDISVMGHAFLRRFVYALEIPYPPKPVRKRIWKKMVSNAGISVTKHDLEKLTNSVQAPPGLLANAVYAAELSGGGVKEIDKAIKSISNLSQVSQACNPSNKNKFSELLTNTNLNLSRLTKRLKNTNKLDFSLCLYGPPGTGKSEYVRYLANMLDMEVLHVRASDLLSKWLGESEQQIAAAFRKAVNEKSFLIFDEADSLLGDRSGASQSWQISQVNEMLTWMESHPYPFACTTNLMNNLDPASLRRFTFKIAYDYLKEHQVAEAFYHFFGLAAPEKVIKLNNLTPGDFAVVAKKAEFLGSLKDAAKLGGMLKDESIAKPGASINPIGFTK